MEVNKSFQVFISSWPLVSDVSPRFTVLPDVAECYFLLP